MLSSSLQIHRPYIRPGRIGDVGCAVGSWIKLACQQGQLRESDFYGIELTRQLYDLCMQRKHNGEFENPNVFFSMKNAVAGLCFKRNSMDTIHSGSITHEIESYGSRDELIQFIDNRFDELKPGGVWINRDVVGPENGDRKVLMWLDDQDGAEHSERDRTMDQTSLGDWLRGLSTFARFLQFVEDFQRMEDNRITFEFKELNDRRVIELSYRDAAEFLLTKDYVENWDSEMHERFCFWGFSDWKTAIEDAGFILHPDSRQLSKRLDLRKPFSWQGRIV